MKEDLLPTDFVKAIQEQLMGFIMDEIVSPSGEFHDDRRFIPYPREASS